jgi:hypothetical protein
MTNEKHEELLRQEAPVAVRDPNYVPGHRFAPGNKVSLGRGTVRQKIANVCFQRALEWIDGDVEPQEADENNPIIQIMKIAKETHDAELALKAWDKCCRYIFGTRSNLNLEVGDGGGAGDEQTQRVQRLFLALGVQKD